MATLIGAENVVGRDRLIATMWKKLETGSLLLTAERRIGKTTVMTRMRDSAPAGVRALYLDVEGLDSPAQFSAKLLQAVMPLLGAQTQAMTWLRGLVGRLGGFEVAGVIKIPEQSDLGWRSTLEQAIDGVCSAVSEPRLVLMLDELPYMLQKISTKEALRGSADNTALEILDVLRACRMTHKHKLRMIFAGSVGLHHVLTDLRGSKYASEPLNDMPKQPIGPLAHDDAVALAAQLLEREAVDCAENDRSALAKAVARVTDCVPFYAERVVAQLAQQELPVVVGDAERTVRRHLSDDQDEWEMEHFRSRLRVYYTGSCADANGAEVKLSSVASVVLDALALAEGPMSIEDVWRAVKAQLPLDDRAQIVQLLASLAKDHYLEGDDEKRYAFRFPLVKRWWVLAQGLNQP